MVVRISFLLLSQRLLNPGMLIHPCFELYIAIVKYFVLFFKPTNLVLFLLTYAIIVLSFLNLIVILLKKFIPFYNSGLLLLERNWGDFSSSFSESLGDKLHFCLAENIFCPQSWKIAHIYKQFLGASYSL